MTSVSSATVSARPEGGTVERAQSQTVKALLRLRELIVSGEVAAGERIAELAMVDRIGVSRTPLRAALVRLEQEGLVEALPSGGYAVKAIGEAEIADSIDIRGALEGLAARLAAERGVSAEALAGIRVHVAEMDGVVGPHAMTDDDFSVYVRANERFHAALWRLCGSDVLLREIERVANLPFASPSGFVRPQAALSAFHRTLALAQEQHRAVVEAIERREGARAEALMREHARISLRHLNVALNNQRSLALLPGAALIRRPV